MLGGSAVISRNRARGQRYGESFALKQQAPVRTVAIIASLVHSSKLTRLLAREGSASKPAWDLPESRVAVHCGTHTEFALWLYLQFHGIERHSVRQVCMAFREAPQALRDGRVDAAVLPHPWTFETSINYQDPVGAGIRELDLVDIPAPHIRARSR